MTPEQKQNILAYVEISGKALAKAAEVVNTQEKTASALRAKAPTLAKTLVELGLIDPVREKEAAEKLADPSQCQAILLNTLSEYRQEKKAREKIAASTLGHAEPETKTAEAKPSFVTGLRTTEEKPYDKLWRERLLGSAN